MGARPARHPSRFHFVPVCHKLEQNGTLKSPSALLVCGVYSQSAVKGSVNENDSAEKPPAFLRNHSHLLTPLFIFYRHEGREIRLGRLLIDRLLGHERQKGVTY